MTNTDSASGQHGMSLWEKWKKVSLPNKFAMIVSAIALLLTILQIVLSVQSGNEQAKFNADVATSQAKIQVTADYQYTQQLSYQMTQDAQQVGMQKTQIAMQSQMDTWARNQVLPFVKAVIPPQPIYIVEKIVAERAQNGYTITGTGNLDFILANNGGGKASLLSVAASGGNNNLFVKIAQAGNPPVILPTTIDGQTPIKIQLDLEGDVPYNDDPVGKSDYQLGEYWKKSLLAHPNHLTVSFANAASIDVEIADIQLAMPEVSYQPDPPSPFEVTNKTVLGILCFRTDHKTFSVETTNLTNKSSAKTVVENGACRSYPVGEYRFLSFSAGLFDESVSIIPGEMGLLDLTKSTPPPGGVEGPLLRFFRFLSENIDGIVFLPIPIVWLLLFLRPIESGFLVVNLTMGFDGSFHSIPAKPIRLFRWGTKAVIQSPYGDIVPIVLLKKTKEEYFLRISEALIHDGNDPKRMREFSMRKGETIEIMTDLGKIEISYHKTNDKIAKEAQNDF